MIFKHYCEIIYYASELGYYREAMLVSIDADYWNAMAAEYAAIHNKVHADEVYKGTRVMF
jgi:hypothetical protein